MLTNEFKREDRYLVLKRADMLEHLDRWQYQDVLNLAKRLSDGRDRNGKPPLECAVIESDWPEYETVWSMIEARMTARSVEAEIRAEVQTAECCNGDCGWTGKVSECLMLGAVGPLCPECREVVEVAPQPPAPRPAPLDESRYCPDCEALQAKAVEQLAEIASVTEAHGTMRSALIMTGNQLEAAQATIAQQAERIAKLEQFQERALEAHPNLDLDVAAIAAMKGGAK